MKSDCRNCLDRTPFCHIECDSYKTFCADNKASKAAKKAYLDKHNAPCAVLSTGYIRRKKKTRLFNGKRVK